MNSALEILEEYWGYSSFIHPQEEIINSIIEGNDTIALLPTGGGKSICFQVPTLVNDGLCIVVSPLIALMNDQVKNLKNKDIKAIALTSKIKQNDLIAVFDNLQYGNYKFLYLSPEKLQTSLVLERLRNLNVQLIAVDEAHCISEWGHDFRPSYLHIHELRNLFQTTPIVALTGSATKKVLEDIVLHLHLKQPKIFKKSFNRNNLAYQIVSVEDKLYKVEQILKKIKGVKIIYTNTRRKTVELSNQLNTLGFASTFYHGGLLYNEKITTFDSWYSEKTPIIIATNAFGMGIDKANVRVVIHYDLPNSVENYMQEAGRAGRDNHKAFSVVLKNETDLHTTQEKFQKSIPSVDFIKKVYFQLNQFYRIAYGELQETVFDFNLTAFCSLYKFPIVLTYNSLKILHKDAVLLLDEKFDRKSTVHFIGSNNQVFDYCDRKPSQEKLVKLLLRTYGGIFESAKPINETFISKSLNVSNSTLIDLLKELHKDELISFYNANSNSQVRFLIPREDDRTINRFSKGIEQRNKLKLSKMQALLSFIENDEVCRNVQLLRYFDESDTKICGICDVCLSQKSTKPLDATDTLTKITSLLEKEESLSSKEIVLLLNEKEQEIIFSLQLLLEKNRIHVTSQNKFRLIN